MRANQADCTYPAPTFAVHFVSVTAAALTSKDQADILVELTHSCKFQGTQHTGLKNTDFHAGVVLMNTFLIVCSKTDPCFGKYMLSPRLGVILIKCFG